MYLVQYELFILSLQAQAAGSSPSHASPRSMQMPIRSPSSGPTPTQGHVPTHGPQDSLAGVGGDVQEAFAQGNLFIYHFNTKENTVFFIFWQATSIFVGHMIQIVSSPTHCDTS